ncbi:MAG TPA: adenylate/guanylate cyclase domain-containing protein [Dehalococcoidia bacterium]
MEPRIQYAKTRDGVNIAYWSIGEGPPLVYLLGPHMSHCQLEWQLPEFRALYERLGRGRQLIRYDSRGSGLSERNVDEITLDSYLLDLEAVVDRLGLEKFALAGALYAGPVTITYAARNPERVSHLILWCAWARYQDLYRSPLFATFRALRTQDWTTYSETIAHSLLGWSQAEAAGRLAAYIRESTTPEMMSVAFAAIEELDVSNELANVKVPTLVMHRQEIPLPDISVARELAAEIPDAELAVLEGQALMPLTPEDVELTASMFDEFIGGAGPAQPDSGTFRTILFTDVEGSTSLTDRLGDARARELLREHERTTREALKEHGGSEVKTMGDGFMASFGSATRALECAVALQRAFEEHNHSATEAIRVRVGLNAGEPIAEDDPGGRSDLFGTAVNLAARIAAKADAGEILVADVVRQLVAGKDFLFNDRGEQALRGFEDPVRVFEVRWRE